MIGGFSVQVSRLLLLSGASPNYATEFFGQAPALMIFAQEGITEMVSLLIEFNADVNLTNSQGCTALTLAAARGHCEVGDIGKVNKVTLKSLQGN